MLEQAFALVHLDFAPDHRQPPNGRVVLATVVSIVGSLLADALLVYLAPVRALRRNAAHRAQPVGR
jgi:hypothetical protein